ncbi:unnamed protein product [Ectocarpus sp. 8 AP-2014]
MSSLRSSSSSLRSSSSSTLCCAVLSTASQDAPLSPMRIRVPDSSSSSGSELSDGGDSPVATTPEAFTDSDNDSSFESEYDEEAAATTCGSNSGMLMEAKCSNSNNSSRWPECTSDMGSSHDGHHLPQQQQQQLEAPRPLRKVRFTLGGRESAKAAASSCWGKEQRAVIQENALRSLGMLRPAESAAPLAQQRRRWQRKQKSSRSSSGSATRAASKNRALAPAPFKSTSANTSSTAVAHKLTTTTTSPFPSIPTPASPKKKRKVSTWSSPSSHRVNVRTSGTGGGGGDSHCRPTRPSSSSGKVAVAVAVAAGKNGRVTSTTTTTTTTTTTSELTVEAAATAALRANEASSARFVPCATTAADSVSVPPRAAPMDLSCTEDVDIDAAMKPGGEVRTPICRFLIPCWPEGVEGYEEAGGWRRLGGSHTKGNFPVGRKSI